MSTASSEVVQEFLREFKEIPTNRGVERRTTAGLLHLMWLEGLAMHGIQVAKDEDYILECINMALWIGGLIVKLQVNWRSIGGRYRFGHDELGEQMTKVLTGCWLCMVGMT